MSESANQLANEHRAEALRFLRQQLAGDAPQAIEHLASFPGQPLEGEGEMSVFAFCASVGGSEACRYHVVSGATTPNYYPAWGLDVDQVYELHLGTRFMLVMQVRTIGIDDLPADWPAKTTAFIGTIAPREPVTEMSVAAAFRVGDELHLVSRLRIAEEEVYVLGLDCPPGVYREIELPPHVIFRKHIGRLIRLEADAEAAEQRTNCE
jgi:hypothetical protein